MYGCYGEKLHFNHFWNQKGKLDGIHFHWNLFSLFDVCFSLVYFCVHILDFFPTCIRLLFVVGCSSLLLMCLCELEIEFAFVVFPSGGLSSLQDQCFNSVRSNSVRSSQHTPRLYQDYEIGTGKRFVCLFLFNFSVPPSSLHGSPIAQWDPIKSPYFRLIRLKCYLWSKKCRLKISPSSLPLKSESKRFGLSSFEVKLNVQDSSKWSCLA